MPVIQGGRWQRFLQKFFGIKGEVVASELAPEIYATIEVGHIPIEMRILDGWRTYLGWLNVPTVAAQTGILRLRNPAGSGVIVVIESAQFYYTNSLQANVGLIIGNNDAPIASIHGTIRDIRGSTGLATVTNSVALVESVSGAAPGGVVFASLGLDVAQGAFSRFSLGGAALPEGRGVWVLMPGDTLGFSMAVVTVLGAGSFLWRERALEPSEVTA